jgi:cellulose synthase operon protein YhjQ
MPVIGFISPLGGTGRTALVANVVTEWAQRKQSALAVDLCPQNQLAGYLGCNVPPQLGWATSALTDTWWGNAAQENSDGVEFLPFGNLPVSYLAQLQRVMVERPNWLSEQIQLMDVAPNTTVLLDVPTWPSPLALQATVCSDMVMVTVDASSRACQSQALLQDMVSSLSASTIVGMVVTGFDARRPSHRAAFQTLRAQWGELMLPYVVHADESVGLAHAQAMSVVRYAPQAQSAADVQGIANWLEVQTQIVALGFA